MKRNILLHTAVFSLVAAVLPGCVSPASHAGGSDASGVLPDGSSPGSTSGLGAAGHVQVIAVQADVTSPGLLVGDQVSCGSPPSSDCAWYGDEDLYATGTMNGTFHDFGHLLLRADSSLAGDGRQIFTGTIAGCGQGVLTFTYLASGGDPDPAYPGDIDGVENYTLVAGSTTTGLAGVVDAHLLYVFHINPATFVNAGKLTGTVSCRTAAVPDLAAGRRQAKPAPIAGDAFTPGLAVVDQLKCGVPSASNPPAACEIYGHEPVYMTGTINGTFVDSGHLHYNSDTNGAGSGTYTFIGSVAGCGSGTMSFTWFGGGGQPDMAHPGDALGFDNLTLIPGSTSLGLAGVQDIRFNFTYHLSQVDYSGSGAVKGTLLCNAAAVPPMSTRHAGAHAVTVTAHESTPGWLHYDQVGCDPAASACNFYLTETLTLTGTLNGTILDIGHARAHFDGSFDVVGTQVFTGTIAGCGSGALAFDYVGGGGDPDIGHPGDLAGFDNLTFLPGGMTTGFAGVVDASILESYHINPATGANEGPLTGTIWCK
jgi:hypothetical protein